MEFGPFTLLAGAQGTGKSSHLHALCAVLTGRTPHTDRRGAGIRDQIRRDQAKAEIELTCQFDGSPTDTIVKRIITETSQSLEVPWGKNLTSRQAILTERMGGVDEVPDVLLDPRLFADRSPDEQRQALLKLLRPPAIEVPQAARAVGIQSLASIQQVDDQIKSLKEGTVRSLNAVIKNLEETIPAETTESEMVEALKGEQGLRGLENQIQSLALEVQHAEHLLEDARKHSQEVEQAKVLVANLPALRLKQDNLSRDETLLTNLFLQHGGYEKDLQYAKERREKVVAAHDAQERIPGLRKAHEEARTQLQNCSERYRRLAAESQDQKAKADALAASIESLRVSIENLKTIEDKCPTCSRKLTQKAKTELVVALAGQKTEQEPRWKDQVQRAEQVAVEAKEEFSKGISARAEVDRLMQEVSTTEQLSREIYAAIHPEEDIASKLSEIKADISKLAAKYQAPVGQDVGRSIRDEIKRTTSEIAEAERAEKLVNAPQPDPMAFEMKVASLKDVLSQKREMLPVSQEAAAAARDTLRRAEDYKAMSARLNTERAKKLQDDTTAIFQRFFPQAHVILDPSGASIAPLASNDGTPVAHLSSGQKVIFDMGLRIAAARVTGFNLLAMDDANKLAPRAREEMLKCLMASGCQVIMCTTADAVGKIPGAVVYSVSSPGVWGPTKVERVGA
jgi:DNA repair exonuclease SbcCD ATPase subunit